MNASPREDVKEIDSNRPYIVLDEHAWTWQRVSWPQGFKLNRRKLPTASRLILLQDLGFGKDGRVWKACSLNGLCCVLKFAHHIDAESSRNDRRTPLQRLEHECANYHKTVHSARVITLGGNPALQLPHYRDLNWDLPGDREMAISEMKSVILKHKMVPMDPHRRHIMHNSPKKAAVIIDRADWRPLREDESAEKELEAHLKALQLQ